MSQRDNRGVKLHNYAVKVKQSYCSQGEQDGAFVVFLPALQRNFHKHADILWLISSYWAVSEMIKFLKNIFRS
jgi:hypothetical protein